ncbi:MAG: hypothetical protein ABG776_01435, partial [Cyanobacteria bacterium J06555_13]
MFLVNSNKTSEAFLLLIRQITVPAILLSVVFVITKGAANSYLIPCAFVIGTAYTAWEQYRYQFRKNLSEITTEGKHQSQPHRGNETEGLT